MGAILINETRQNTKPGASNPFVTLGVQNFLQTYILE